ncbi:type II toxin-antitoxin system RelE/ParE family toxin [Cupriavidus sp. 2SB]|uniref:type II toxin-antitoxin system RelE family toxin n=1 Tax=Cupriavidus sp. 2SB TaxID=2502199 RepID=UPI0010F5C301|nr:type II toxin-antitoxin system RelE/ParE family toxin [Cupriavidus sp. 2SB]
MYSIEFTKVAGQQLMTMPRNMACNVRAKINLLAQDPYATNPNVRKLAGRDGCRLRVGDWRILYRVEADRLVIVVMNIKPRRSAYQ